MPSDLDSQKNLLHLEYARTIVSEQRYNSLLERSALSCFEFVNGVLRETLSEEAFNELTMLHKMTNASLPLSHQYHEIIPYHYHLLARHIQNSDLSPRFWRERSVFEARPGDLFVYVDPFYDPDPTKRKIGQPSGTHVALIDEVLNILSDHSVTFRMIDSSKRRKGRGYAPDYDASKGASSYVEGGVAYSTMTLKLLKDEQMDNLYLWRCHILGQRSTKKLVTILRIDEHKSMCGPR